MSSPLPALVSISRSGEMAGRTGRHERRYSDLAGLFADEAAYTELARTRGGEVAYHVDEFRPSERVGGMRVLIVADDEGGWTQAPNPRYRGHTEGAA